MKKTFLLIISSLLIWTCIQSTRLRNSNYQQVQQRSKAGPLIETNVNQHAKPTALGKLFTLPDAEKIIGQPAHLADSSTKREGNVLIYRCAFKANSEDVKTHKTGAIYFLAEEYSQISSAQKKYSSIKKANENHEGIKVLDNLGDEAYFHSDGENFYFIMVRKGTSVFNMKVNKITSTTSLDDFNVTAKHITAAL
jgi:hypothetical protein